MKKFIRLAMALVALFAAPAWAGKGSLPNTSRLPTTGEPGYAVELTASAVAGVYLLGPATRSAAIEFTKASDFAGVLYTCALQDADTNNDGAVDASAECVSIATLTADTTATYSGAGRYWVLDVNTAESGANVSQLTIRGSVSALNGSGSGGVISLAAASLPVTGDESIIYQITDASSGTDCDNVGGGTTPAYCGWDPTALDYVAIGSAATGLTNPLVADLDADTFDIIDAGTIDGVIFADPNTPGTTTAGIQEAIDSCPDGSTAGRGCTIWLPKGRHNITSSINLGGLTYTGSTGMQNGLHIIGHGSGILNSNASFDALAGTTLVWAGANGGTMLRVTGFGHVLEHFVLAGGATTNQGEAGFGIVQIGNNAGGGVPTGKNTYRDILIQHINDYTLAANGWGFRIGKAGDSITGQNDHTILEQVRVHNSAHCFGQDDQQAVNNYADQLECASISGSPVVLVSQGGMHFNHPYIGGVADNAVGFQIDNCVTQSKISDPTFEWDGDNGTPIRYNNPITADCNAYGVAYATHVIEHPRFLIQHAASIEHTCIEHDSNSDLIVRDVMFTSNTTGATYRCDLEFNNPDASRVSHVTLSGNRVGWYYGNEFDPISMTVTAAAAGGKKVISEDNGKLTFTDEAGSQGIAKDATSMFVDNNGDGDYDAGQDARFGGLLATDVNLGLSLVDGLLDFDITPTTTGGVGLLAEQCIFSSGGTGGGGFLCEGSTANAFEHLHIFPTTDAADTTDFIPTSSAAVTVTPSTSKCARFDSSGNLVAASGDCTAGDTGGTFALDDASDVAITTPATGAVLVKSGTDWVDGQLDLDDSDALTNTLGRSNGGTNADTSAYGAGLIGSDGSNNTIDVDTTAELETALGAVNVLLETEIDAGSELAALLDDETGSSGGGVPVFSNNPTLTGITMAAAASPNLHLTDSDGAGGDMEIALDGSAAGPDSIVDLEIDIGGTLTTLLRLDGVTELVNLYRPTTFGNGATSSGVIRILEDSDDGTNYASFQVPALAANTVYTLPADDGDAGEQLQTNGSGTLSWEAPGTGGGITSLGGQTGGTQTFSSTNTSINITSGTNNHDIEVDVAPSSGSATLEVSEDAVQVKYSSTHLAEGASGLALSASSRTRVCSIPIVADGSGNLTHVDRIARCKIPDASTLVKVSCTAGQSNGFNIQLFERASTTPNTGTTDMLGGDLACDTDNQEDTAFSDSAIAADAYLVIDITSESLAAGEHGFIALEYTVD